MKNLSMFSFAIAGAMALGAVALAEIRMEAVEYHDGETVLEGWMAWDASYASTRPGVMVVHEWTGVNDYQKARARQLAELGYVAFAADIYGKGVNPPSGPEAAAVAGSFRGGDRENFRTRLHLGLEQLREHELSAPERLAAIGYCFGGTGVLELARSGADVAGVVSFHGGLTPPEREEEPNVKAEVLVLHGAVDPHVPMEEVAAFVDEMESAGATYSLIMYSGAVHSFTNPGAGDDPSTGNAYQERADRESWRDMQAFFERLFAPEGTGLRIVE